MARRLLESCVIALVGVFLLWLGFRGVASSVLSDALPSNSLIFVGGLIAIIAGEWFCWHGAGRLISPPEWSYRIVNVLCAAFLGALILTGCIILIRIVKVS